MNLARRTRQAARLARGGLRHPNNFRYLPRLQHTMGSNTLDLGLPWLPYSVIERLEAALTPTSRVFEFGGGGSTIWFSSRAGQVVTAEHDAEWASLLEARTASARNVELVFRTSDDAYTQYVHAIDAYPNDYFDIVLVDGRERVSCFRQAITKVAPNGLLILDDVERERYQPAFDALTWPRTVYTGYAPCKDELAHTAVFSRPSV